MRRPNKSAPFPAEADTAAVSTFSLSAQSAPPGQSAECEEQPRDDSRRATRRHHREGRNRVRRSAVDGRRIMPAGRSVILIPRLKSSFPADDGQDFGSSESRRVFASAALAVARELGAQAAREYFVELMQQRASK